MSNKIIKNITKTLLATSSVLAFSGGLFIQTSEAATILTTNPQNTINSKTTVPNDWTPAQLPANGDALYYGGNHEIIYYNAPTFEFSTISPNSQTNIGPVSLRDNDGFAWIIGSVADNDPNSAMVTVNFNDFGTLFLSEVANGSYAFGMGNYNRLGTINFTNDTIVQVEQSTTLPTTFQASGSNNNLNVSGANGSPIIVNLDGSFNSAQPISNLNIRDATVNLNTDLFLVHDVFIDSPSTGQKTTLNVANNKNLTVINITSDSAVAPIAGTELIFQGDSIVQSLPVGSSKIQMIDKIAINDGNVIFRSVQSLRLSNLEFNHANAILKIEGPEDTLMNQVHISTNVDNTGVIELSNRAAITSDVTDNYNTFVGANGNGTGPYLKGITFATDTFLFTNQELYVREIAPTISGNGNVIFIPNVTTPDNSLNIVTNIGTVDKKIKLVGIDSELLGGNLANNGATITIKPNVSIYANEFNLHYNIRDIIPAISPIQSPSQNTNVILSDNVTIDADITTLGIYDVGISKFTNSPFGKITTEGNATFKGQIGTNIHKLQALTFSNLVADSRVSLFGDIYTNQLSADNSFEIKNDINVKSNSSNLDYSSNGNIYLNNHILSFNAGTTSFEPNSQPNIHLTISDLTTSGRIRSTGSNKLDMSAINNLQINISDLNIIPPATETIFPVFYAENDATLTLMDDSFITINEVINNPFSNWSYRSEGGNGYLVLNRNGNPVDIIGSSNPNLFIALNSDARDEVGITFIKTPEKVDELLNRIVADPTPKAVNHEQQANTTQISNRLDRLAGPSQFAEIEHEKNKIFTDNGENSYGLGVSAGQDHHKYGLWMAAITNHNIQRQVNDHPGYKARSFGATIGFDAELENVNLLGGAFSFADSTVNHKNANDGDKSYLKTYIFSLYGLQELSGHSSVQGVVSYAKSNVDNQEKRIVASSAKIAKAKYNFHSLAAEGYLNYDALLSKNTMFTPNIGLALTRNASFSYQETGASNQNLSVKKKSEFNIEAIVGAQLVFASSDNATNLVPDFHGEIRYDLLRKKQLISATLPGSSVPLILPEPNKTRISGSIGTGLTIRTPKMDYSVTYDLFLAKGYRGHQGAITVRINF